MNNKSHGEELPTFAQFRPTQFDPPGVGSDETNADWRILPVIQTRDSGPLEESNFYSSLKLLGGESEETGVEVHRFGHWGPGWFEIIAIRPTERNLEIAGSIVCALADYPILEYDDYSLREWQDRVETFENCHEYDLRHEADSLEDDIPGIVAKLEAILADLQHNLPDPDSLLALAEEYPKTALAESCRRAARLINEGNQS